MELPNTFDVKMFLHPSVSNPYGADAPLVLIVAFLANSSSFLSGSGI